MNRRITYVCPVCAASMLETEPMEQERLSEVERLQGAVDLLTRALLLVKRRPAQESAFIAAVNLQEAEKHYGVTVDWSAS